MILGFIGVFGYVRGLQGLESLEKVAVNVKMSITGGLLLVLALFNWRGGSEGLGLPVPLLTFHSLQVLGGMLLITQGFETVKYLGHRYRVRPRVRVMLLAQGIATAVYLGFVWLVAPLAVGVDASKETAIIGVISKLAIGLGIVLSVGAILSQFSAGVADTVCTGGIVEQETRRCFSERQTYVVIAALAIALLWTLDIFSVMALASRGVAAHYSLRSLIAAITAWHQPRSVTRGCKLFAFPFLALLLLLITIFAIPAEGAE